MAGRDELAVGRNMRSNVDVLRRLEVVADISAVLANAAIIGLCVCRVKKCQHNSYLKQEQTRLW